MNVLQTARPPFNPGRQAIQYPSKVNVTSRALFQILSHAVRRKADQARVIGTIVGVRSDDGNEIEVKTAYIVPIDETDDEVNIDIEYHKEMFQLTRRAYPDSVILGWYATSSNLDNLSALIHDFYSQQHGTFPYPAILLTIQSTAARDIDVRTYIASSIGVPSEISLGNCIFLPVSNTVTYSGVEKSALQLVGFASEDHDKVAEVLPNTTNVDESLDEVIEQLEKIQEYIKSVISGSTTPNTEVGKSLYRTLSLSPNPSVGSVKELYASYIEELKSVVQLTDAVRSQLELTSELTTLV